ncbi:hypothetical protein [Nocardioides sp.]|uniref:hypothetical protein n=1 Tax=Nocardioides sp. TaxID=35761 RepID=UPI0035675F87
MAVTTHPSAPRPPSTMKAMLLGALLALIASIGVVAATKAASSSPATPPSSAGFSRLDANALHQNRCASSGLATVSKGPQALIRTPRGRLRLVSFEKGWEIYTGDRPGTLVAICNLTPGDQRSADPRR